MCQHLDFLWFPWFLCETKRTSRNFFLSTDSTEFRHVWASCYALAASGWEHSAKPANASLRCVICLSSCVIALINKNIHGNLWDYLWTFMLKNTNTKRSSLAAGAEGNDHALTVLTECFCLAHRKHRKHRMHVLRLCEPPDSLQVLSTELKLITLFFASCYALAALPDESTRLSRQTRVYDALSV